MVRIMGIKINMNGMWLKNEKKRKKMLIIIITTTTKQKN